MYFSRRIFRAELSCDIGPFYALNGGNFPNWCLWNDFKRPDSSRFSPSENSGKVGYCIVIIR